MSRQDQIEIRVRRAPKYGVFVGVGLAVGVVAALLFVTLDPAGEDAQQVTLLSTYAFFGVTFALAGGLLGGLVAIVLDRISGPRARTERVTGTFEEAGSPTPSEGEGAAAAPERHEGD